MTRRLLVSPDAECDAESAARWYWERGKSLGARLLDEPGHALERIHENPVQFPRIEGQARRALSGTFPNGVYSLVRPDRVVVLAILHPYCRPVTPVTWKRPSKG